MLTPPGATGRRAADPLRARLRGRRRPVPPPAGGATRPRPAAEPGADPTGESGGTLWTAVWESAANEQYFAVPSPTRSRVDALVRRLVTDRPAVPATYDEDGGIWTVQQVEDGVDVGLTFRLVDATRQLVISRVTAAPSS